MKQQNERDRLAIEAEEWEKQERKRLSDGGRGSAIGSVACGLLLGVALLPTFICIQVFYCMLIKLLLRFAAVAVGAVCYCIIWHTYLVIN